MGCTLWRWQAGQHSQHTALHQQASTLPRHEVLWFQQERVTAHSLHKHGYHSKLIPAACNFMICRHVMANMFASPVSSRPFSLGIFKSKVCYTACNIFTVLRHESLKKLRMFLRWWGTLIHFWQCIESSSPEGGFQDVWGFFNNLCTPQKFLIFK
jgi:hypothetical protein